MRGKFSPGREVPTACGHVNVCEFGKDALAKKKIQCLEFDVTKNRKIVYFVRVLLRVYVDGAGTGILFIFRIKGKSLTIGCSTFSFGSL